LINNAGIAIYKLIKDTTDEDFDRIFDINVKGVFNTMKEASTLLADNGRIINFSSSVTRLMLPTYGTYSATKSAVEQLTRVFAKEVGAKGITVNSISPGPVNTELFKQGKNEEVIKHLASMSAFNRIGEPEDIAKIVLFLVDEDSKWITGQNIGVNGGFA
jgi:3-oxoacyl-[acyl-carrier protein] reductase